MVKCNETAGSKISTISDFFKPFTKRPLSSDGSDALRSIRNTPSTRSNGIRVSLPRGAGPRETKEQSSMSPPELSTTEQIPFQYDEPSKSRAQSTEHTQSHVKSSFELPTSQVPMSSGSQRRVRKGEEVVTNTDDELDSSSSSLEDIDDLLRAHKTTKESTLSLDAVSSDPLAPWRANEEMNPAKRRNTRYARESMASQSELPQPSIRKYKNSLALLANQRKQFEASKEDIARADSLFHSSSHEFERDRQSLDGIEKIDEDLIDTVMQRHGDEEEIGRLKNAIDRTEALQHSKSWFFFEGASNCLPSGMPDFPTVKNKRLGTLFRDARSREQSFLSGYVGEHATKEKLPEELLLWIIDATSLEPRDDLRHAYTNTAKDSGPQAASLLSCSLIDRLFQTNGASTAALKTDQVIVPRASASQDIEDHNRPRLLSLIDLLGHVAGSLDPRSRVHAICILCRLFLDRTIVNKCLMRLGLEEAFANMVESIPEQDCEVELQNVLTLVYQTVSEATLRLCLLQHLPVFGARPAMFRRRLALAFFFGDPSYFSKPSESLVDLKVVASILRGPRFHINHTTNYAEIAASITFLNIGIDSGDPPPASEEENLSFDDDIDVLSTSIKDIFTQIIDTLGLNSRRTEAKETLEGFQYRLSYAVRTRPKPKMRMFGGSVSDYAVERRAIAGWLTGEKGEEEDVGTDGVDMVTRI